MMPTNHPFLISGLTGTAGLEALETGAGLLECPIASAALESGVVATTGCSALLFIPFAGEGHSPIDDRASAAWTMSRRGAGPPIQIAARPDGERAGLDSPTLRPGSGAQSLENTGSDSADRLAMPGSLITLSHSTDTKRESEHDGI